MPTITNGDDMEAYKAKVLIIDDDPKTREVLQAVIVRDGHTVDTAGCGVDGILFAERTPPDIILLNLFLPDVNGMEVCRKLRRNHATRSIPVIMMTGIFVEDVKVDCLSAGATEFITKPIDPTEIRVRVRNLAMFNAVARAKMEWEGSMDCVRDMVILVDEAGLIRRCNKPLADYLHMPYATILGAHWLKLLRDAGLLVQTATDTAMTLLRDESREWFDIDLYRGRDDLFAQSTVVVLRNTTEIRAMTATLAHQAHELKLDRDRFESFWNLGKMGNAPRKDLVDFALKAIVRLTESDSGYLHFLALGEAGGEHYAWSKHTPDACAAEQEPDCPVGSEDTRADAIRLRQTVIRNDCSSPQKELWASDEPSAGQRCMSVPVFEGQSIIAVAGVANKEQPYTEEDAKQVELFLAELWKILKQQMLDRQLMQQEKMASIGQLSAGIAHEINNPTGFIMSNLRTFGKYGDRLVEFIREQGKAVDELPQDVRDRLFARRKELKVDYIINDLRNIVRESLEGAERIKKIVQDLKNFSRMDQSELSMADINAGIESTINIVWNELKYKATLVKELGDLPRVRCNAGQLNQVFMNILVNAAHAIEQQGQIRVRTWTESGRIKVSIADTGCGIPPDKLGRIFEPFFTTKEVGKGTGLGLSIAYDIIKKHNGTIEVASEVGKGTTFMITIPVVGEERARGMEPADDGREPLRNLPAA